MLEVELKFRVVSRAEVVAAIEAQGATAQARVEQVDQYFGHPCRDFAQTDEALRIRQVGSDSFLTYKGPKIDATTKTRREIDLPLAEGIHTDFRELLTSLGFLPVAKVRKTRTTYPCSWHAWQIEIAVDDVDGLGSFVEIETRASQSDLPAAREAITSLAACLGLEGSERKSYLELLQTHAHPD